MKLNYKRTILVGFAFFLICTFWQAYDTIIPKILTDKFGMTQAASGVIMALDNVLALFMLPLFGSLSDRCKSRLGRRTPYILVGTIVAAVFFFGLSFIDNWQMGSIAAGATIDDPAALGVLYDAEQDETLKTATGESFVLGDTFTREEFTAIRSQLGTDPISGELLTSEATETALAAGESLKLSTNPDYSNYVTPARQSYAWKKTVENPAALIAFILVLLVVLVAMAIFRSPAVALMPDVTIKPLRSKGNAVINLMGTAGGIIVLALGTLFHTGSVKNALMSYTLFFGVVAGLMLAALAIFLWKVKEPQFVLEMREESKRYGIDEYDGTETGEKRRLTPAERRSLLLILASVVLWFMGYNAVTSKYSVYAGKVLSLDYNATLMIANVAAIISYLPVGFVASKIGRKKTILAGIVMLTGSFLVASFLREGSSAMLMNAMFALAGIGWATINVNSFPMVVELARGGDVGKYTGFYYTASMAAQTATPFLSGLLMDKVGMTSLFPYATVFAALAFFTMLPVKHGDSKPLAKKDLSALDVGD